VVGNGHGERPWEQVVSSRIVQPNLVTDGEAVPNSLTSALRLIANMSRRAPIVEEFDDDTDLPLPSLSLPDTGSRGAILEEIADTDDDEGGDSDDAPELLDPSAIGGSGLQPSARDTRVTDITPYKKYANDIISNVIGQWPAHSPHLGGHVFIQFTSMQSDHMEPVLGGYRDPRVCGGLLAKTSQMPALASG